MTLHTGTLHSWHDDKGFGFIKPDNGGQNIFIHIRELKDGSAKPSVGDLVSYHVTQDNNGRPKACDASVRRRGNLVPPSNDPAWTSGILRTWDDKKGFGFIRPKDNGRDVFLHINDFKDNHYRPIVGATVYYKIKRDDDGKARAYEALIKDEQHKQPQRKIGIARWFLAILPFTISAHALAYSKTIVPALAYAVMSAITFIAYAIDKSRALRGEWRVPERSLHTLELLGGWPGALIAQGNIRHKVIKREYQAVFWMIFGIHAAAWAGYFYLSYPSFQNVMDSVRASLSDTNLTSTQKVIGSPANPRNPHNPPGH